LKGEELNSASLGLEFVCRSSECSIGSSDLFY